MSKGFEIYRIMPDGELEKISNIENVDLEDNIIVSFIDQGHIFLVYSEFASGFQKALSSRVARNIRLRGGLKSQLHIIDPEERDAFLAKIKRGAFHEILPELEVTPQQATITTTKTMTSQSIIKETRTESPIATTQPTAKNFEVAPMTGTDVTTDQQEVIGTEKRERLSPVTTTVRTMELEESEETIKRLFAAYLLGASLTEIAKYKLSQIPKSHRNSIGRLLKQEVDRFLDEF